MARKVAATRFLDVALSTKGQLFHSYPNHELKWLIRNDLLTLIRNFPSLSLRATTTTPPLLEAYGLLLTSSPIHLTIRLRSFHPFVDPIVTIAPPFPSLSPTCPHPFVDPLTGATTTPYLLMWQHPKSNLNALVDNLVKIFQFWPIHSPNPPHSLSERRCNASRREALDRLSMMLFYDLSAYSSSSLEEKEALESIKSTLSSRAIALTETTRDFEREVVMLKEKLEEVHEATSALSKWLSDMKSKELNEDRDMEAFEVVEDLDSKLDMCKLCAEAIKEAMEVADEALKSKDVVLVEYLREIRVMAKEYFHQTKDSLTFC